jgi:hypothetical protein
MQTTKRVWGTTSGANTNTKTVEKGYNKTGAMVAVAKVVARVVAMATQTTAVAVVVVVVVVVTVVAL